MTDSKKNPSDERTLLDRTMFNPAANSPAVPVNLDPVAQVREHTSGEGYMYTAQLRKRFENLVRELERHFPMSPEERAVKGRVPEHYYVERLNALVDKCQEIHKENEQLKKSRDNWRQLCLNYDAQRMQFRDQLKLAYGLLQQWDNSLSDEWGDGHKTDEEKFVMDSTEALLAAAPPTGGLPESQEPKYTVTSTHIINRATGEPIPHDEPVFIFRAKDVFAISGIQYYLNAVGQSYQAYETKGQAQYSEHLSAVQGRLSDFHSYKERHKETMSVPDTRQATPTQTRFGTEGDCVRHVLAWFFNKRVEHVPDFVLDDVEEHYEQVELFIDSQGYDINYLAPDATPPGNYIATGISPRGTHHAVVMTRGRLAYDPHPDRSGLTEVKYIWKFTKKLLNY